MATIKSTFKRWNGSEYDVHYFYTSADVIAETTSYKVMTAAERTAISTYLSTFNAADKLLKLDGSGLVPTSLIPGGLDYLPLSGGTLTGALNGASASFTASVTVTSGLYSPQGIFASSSRNSGIELIDGSSNDVFTLYTTGTARLTVDETGLIDFKGNALTNIGTPTNNTDATTKEYVDGLVGEGVSPKDSVKCATTGNITLSGLQTIDSHILQESDRILVKNQTTTAQNGIYTASSGSWTKVTADSSQGVLVFVKNRLINNNNK
jgi:hypothetical protein